MTIEYIQYMNICSRLSIPHRLKRINIVGCCISCSFQIFLFYIFCNHSLDIFPQMLKTAMRSLITTPECQQSNVLSGFSTSSSVSDAPSYFLLWIAINMSEFAKWILTRSTVTAWKWKIVDVFIINPNQRLFIIIFL